MKNLIILLAAFLSISTVANAQMSTKTSKDATTKTTYTCPMHPDQMSMKEGKCGKCGMDLVKKTEIIKGTVAKTSQTSTVKPKYICSMDGTTSDKPGKCSKCGMALSKKQMQATTYACPMHPTVTGKKGDNCSKCGMAMTKVDVKK